MHPVKTEKQKSGHNISAGAAVTIAVILVLIPLIIFFSAGFKGRSFYATSFIVIILTLIPFFLVFESKRPKAREVVLIAVLTALSICSRVVFAMVPFFKPMSAMIMLTGIALGPQAGFLSGALAAFVSNFFFSQGPWTPWQMFAYGMAGFLSGIVTGCGRRLTGRFSLTILGGALVMLIVGPLLDTCAVFTMSSYLSLSQAAATYIAGLYPNAVHAAATALTMLLAGPQLLSGINRIKIKYGMYVR